MDNDATTERSAPDAGKYPELRMLVRFFYDAQKLRHQASVRALDATKQAALAKDDKIFLGRAADALSDIEKATLKEIRRQLQGIPIYEGWLKDQKGVGPTIAGVLVSSVDIERATTASKLWRFCGLATVPDPGDADRRIAERRRKGERLRYDPWLKSKIVFVMGGCLLKSNSPYRKFYDDYKHRKLSQRTTCQLCTGVGRITSDGKPFVPDKDNGKGKSKKKGQKCTNCKGEGRGPWGRSDAHRHRAATRYMCKMFLLDLWREWRLIEELPVRPPYAEEYLGRVHGAAG